MGAPAVLMGDQRPRLHLVPPCVSNATAEVVELYELTGRSCDEWQELILRTGLGERDDGSWAAFENGVIVPRQNGKGIPIEALLLASLFVWGNKVTIYSAHRLDTVGKTFRGVKALIEGTADLLRRCKPIHDSDDAIELVGGARVEFKTRGGREGGRGLTGDLVILDEALMLTPEHIDAIVPSMAARPYAQLWYFSTVPKFGDQFLCTARARVEDGDTGISWCEWGVDRGADPRDPQVLARSNPALGRRVTLERLGQLYKILGPDGFATECLGIWPSMSTGAVLDPKRWRDDMLDPGSRYEGDVALAIDVSPLRDVGIIGLFGYRPDGLEHVQLLDVRPGVDWIPERAAELAAVLNPLGWAVQQNGAAYALREDLAAVGIVEPEDPAVPERGQLLVLDVRGVSDGCAQFIDAFRRGALRHVGQGPLDDGVRFGQARQIGDQGKIAWARRKSEVNIGGLVTVTDARYLYVTWHDLVSGSYDLLGSIPLAEGQCPHCEAWAPSGSRVDHYDDCVTRQEGRVPADA